MKNRFQNLPFKFQLAALQRGAGALVRPLGGAVCTLTPPDPQLPIAERRRSFNPRTYHVKNRFQSFAFHQKCNLHRYDSEFLGGGAKAASWEAVELGPGHGVTWNAASVVGKGIDRADLPGEAVEATVQARDECGRPWAGASLALRATLVGPLSTHVRQLPAHVAPMGATGGVYNVKWSTTACGHHALRLERFTVGLCRLNQVDP
jgi:hypothetical protein